VRKKTGRTGFTLVEIIVGLAVSSILASILGALLYYNFLLWQRNTAMTLLQQDASVIMDMLSKKIRSAKDSDITISDSDQPKTMRIGNESFYWQSATAPSTLWYDPDTNIAGNEIALATNEVTAFVPDKNSPLNSATVTITLLRNSQSVTLNFYVMYRNKA